MKYVKRCPWCGKEAFPRFTVYPLRSRWSSKVKYPCCRLCGCPVKPHISTHARTSRVLSDIGFYLLLLLAVVALVVTIIGELAKEKAVQHAKIAEFSTKYGMYFVISFFAILVLLEILFCILSFYVVYVRVSRGDLEPPPFELTFDMKLKIHSRRDGGYRFYKWRFADYIIFGAEIKTNSPKYKYQEIPLVMKNARFLDDRTVVVTAGFVCSDNEYQDLAREGMELTLIKNDRRFASGVITKMLLVPEE